MRTPMWSMPLLTLWANDSLALSFYGKKMYFQSDLRFRTMSICGQTSSRRLATAVDQASDLTTGNDLPKMNPANNSSAPWKPGNVEQDLFLYKQELKKLSHPINEKLRENVFMMDRIYRGKRLLLPDLLQLVLPIVVGGCFRKFSTRMAKLTGRCFRLLGQIHYVFLLVYPTLALGLIYFHRAKTQKFEAPALPTWNMPKTHHQYDPATFLMEYLWSSTFSASLFQIWACVKKFSSGWVVLCTRWAAVVSMHQYPVMVHMLETQRPLTFSQTLVRPWMVQWIVRILPWAMTGDLLFFIEQKHFFPRSYLATSVALLAPLIHAVASFKIIRIRREARVSLTQGDFSEQDSTVQWRWSLRWRPPLSLGEVMWKFWLFCVAGYDVSQKDSSKRSYSVTPNFFRIQKPRDQEVFSKNKWNSPLLELQAKRLKEDNKEEEDRNEWVARSLRRMAHEHQQNYDAKQFDDYLGIALHQTTGLGLSYDYDHDSLPEGDVSVHRLRARFTKSVIYRLRHSSSQIKQLKQDLLKNIPVQYDVIPEGTQERMMEVLTKSDLNFNQNWKVEVGQPQDHKLWKDDESSPPSYEYSYSQNEDLDTEFPTPRDIQGTNTSDYWNSTDAENRYYV